MCIHSQSESFGNATVTVQSEYFHYVTALSPDLDPSEGVTVKLGVSRNQFQQLAARCQRTTIGQFWGIVEPGLILAKHCFRGLNRGVCLAEDMDVSARTYVYCWKPRWDYVWVGDPNYGRTAKRTPPDRRVFVVLVTKNRDVDEDNVFGTIAHWNWIKESAELSIAPIGHSNRYEQHCWER